MALWPFGTKEEVSLSSEQRAALGAVVKNAKFELIPLKNVRDQAAALPPGARATVTASPTHGIEATFDISEYVAGLGHEVTPHLSAHMIRDRAHLADLLGRARAIGLRHAFIVGGDAKDSGGAFHNGLDLLRAMQEIGHPFDDIGVPSYPEGHADIPDDVLMKALKDKQQYAKQTTTQMSFNPGAVSTWVDTIRGEGVTLPIYLGVPGVLEVTKLMTIAARIGVGASASFLSKNMGLVGALVRPGSFGADTFLKSLADTIANPASRVAGLHIFTMNQVPATVEWHQKLTSDLGA
jgi:methylenetetrahydrofolate reductase (NADPH)